MIPALHAELIKLHTTRSTLALGAGGLTFAGINGYATAALAGRDGNAELGTTANLAGILIAGHTPSWISLLVGVLAVTGEYRHRTVTTTFLATPRRLQVAGAKLALHATLGALYTAAAMLVGLLAAAPVLAGARLDHPITSNGHLGRVAMGAIVVAALFGAVGVAVGAVVRNQTAATIGSLVWLVAAENMVGPIAGWPVARWLPGQAANAIAGASTPGLLPMAPAIVVLVAYIIAALALATLTLNRDLT